MIRYLDSDDGLPWSHIWAVDERAASNKECHRKFAFMLFVELFDFKMPTAVATTAP